MNPLKAKPAVSKILIVDDNAEMRRMTRFFLTNTYDFEECADGADALDCYEKTRPDWVLMDWEMKRMNGIEATRRIVEKYPEANVVIVTQYDDPELRGAALKAGARDFILKENLFDLRHLIAANS
ncbi:MAG: response regulator transcription factor [Acidobacteriota bacterium]|nr:response regulator transcription factor [Acidobacteriota bacterium]